MGHLHRAFLLNATGFKKAVAPILTSLDVGDAQPLFERAVAIVEQTIPSEWILRLAGASLLDIRKVDSIGHLWTDSIENRLKDVSAIPSYEIGYWLLIVFSTSVQRCPGIGYNYSILEWVLDVLGWNQGDRQLLFKGVSTSLLLRPGEAPVSALSPKDTYWHWMIPPHSKGRGWLSQKQALEVYHRLLSEERAIQTFDYRRFRDLRVPEPEGQLDYFRRLQAAYERAIMMFESAHQAQMELYMTISYE